MIFSAMVDSPEVGQNGFNRIHTSRKPIQGTDFECLLIRVLEMTVGKQKGPLPAY